MPETAPLDVTEATVGYELDSITLRDIASVRYVRHHEWLDHLLGSPLPTQAIIPPKITKILNEEDIATRTKELENEIAELEAEKQAGWKFHLDENKAHSLTSTIHELRDNFGSGSIEGAQNKIENLLGVKIVEASAMRPVRVTYDRQKLEREQAKVAIEKQKQKEEEEAKAEAAASAASTTAAPSTQPGSSNTTPFATGGATTAPAAPTSASNASGASPAPSSAANPAPNTGSGAVASPQPSTAPSAAPSAAPSMPSPAPAATFGTPSVPQPASEGSGRPTAPVSSEQSPASGFMGTASHTPSAETDPSRLQGSYPDHTDVNFHNADSTDHLFSPGNAGSLLGGDAAADAAADADLEAMMNVDS